MVRLCPATQLVVRGIILLIKTDSSSLNSMNSARIFRENSSVMNQSCNHAFVNLFLLPIKTKDFFPAFMSITIKTRPLW